jgi:hypothetical protein
MVSDTFGELNKCGTFTALIEQLIYLINKRKYQFLYLNTPIFIIKYPIVYLIKGNELSTS